MQYIEKNFGGGNATRDVLYVPGSEVDLIFVGFSRELTGKPNAIKKAIRGNKPVMFWYDQI